MIEIEKPKIECVEDPANGTYGKFTVEPLERGYGITLGNALRRIMLSSLPGTAATSIKIAGVQHEFSTIPGVKEDVTEIVLNVKSLITRLHNTDGIKTVYIEAVGPCEVKAGDIKGDSEVEVLNPDLHIATLDAGATLNMELTLSHGHEQLLFQGAAVRVEARLVRPDLPVLRLSRLPRRGHRAHRGLRAQAHARGSAPALRRRKSADGRRRRHRRQQI